MAAIESDGGAAALYRRERASGRVKRTTENSPRTTDNGQRTTDNGQRTTDNGQRTTNNEQRTTDNEQRNHGLTFGAGPIVFPFGGDLEQPLPSGVASKSTAKRPSAYMETITQFWFWRRQFEFVLEL